MAVVLDEIVVLTECGGRVFLGRPGTVERVFFECVNHFRHYDVAQ